MVKIIMKRTLKGSEDGIHIRLFKKGEEVTTTARLAQVFTENKAAEYVEETDAEKATTTPTNKMARGPKNKATGEGKKKKTPAQIKKEEEGQYRAQLIKESVELGLDKEEAKKTENEELLVFIDKEIKKGE